ncbi:alpha-1,2mannosyltransferase KTR1 [Colletotrichum tofieldiae]|uniref:O-glycoside alpha-1,2-mannosyltransferase 4 n=2 Tax=Colletotrichum spaethianum species complex TaxID=2707349 RepID=A0AA37GHL0_9PEZI|nr:O-glycoside alpha-1,2-mannosyltransferase 4 [Colletotrichum liriopes]GKT54323.1 alpha-1,2mannosyltransferase KTR1 [Colletotrichum tofieldiae]GKT74044.1 alpha-1,2mannosyltransferase KTR1 [Colletotrichum tofieldiae]
MDLFRRAVKAIPSTTPQLPTADEKPTTKHARQNRLTSRLAFFRRPLRLRGNSSISVPLGVVILFPLIVVILILVLFVRHPSSPGRILMPAGAPPAIRKISEEHDKVFVTGCLEPDTSRPKANGAFVVLARNKELDGVIQSIKSIERHFNRWYHYPYVFLNDGDFNETFKEVVKNYTSAPVEFGKVGPEMWGYPDWIDHKVAKEGIAKQGDAAVMYGGLESYHAMCRFYSGFFYKHELLAKYNWYWRLEPEIKYFCDITYDPFWAMIDANKTYGFTIAVKELRETVPNIFRYASAYKRLKGLKSKGLWEMFVDPVEKKEEPPTDQSPLPEEVLRSDPNRNNLPDVDPEAMEGETYNMCHFWSNFEIASLDWFRSKEYEEFFEMMDRSGGFWMERWGDAPIHSLAAGALLSPRDIHYFRDFGYRHTTIQHCPANAPARQLPRQAYLEKTTLDEKKRIEEDKYWDDWDAEKENGVGCRCRCDTDIVDVEGKEGSCLAEWVDVAGGWASP